METALAIYAAGAILTAAIMWMRMRKNGNRMSVLGWIVSMLLWPAAIAAAVTADW